MLRKIGVLTSGGDSPGMNAAIRATTRAALASGIEVVGIRDGYRGLYKGQFIPFTAKSVSETIAKGGTILGSARLPEFKDEEVQLKAIENI